MINIEINNIVGTLDDIIIKIQNQKWSDRIYARLTFINLCLNKNNYSIFQPPPTISDFIL